MSSHILSIYFCRCKQFNISIQQYSCIAFYRLNKFKLLTTHYICIQLSRGVSGPKLSLRTKRVPRGGCLVLKYRSGEQGIYALD